MYYKVLKDNGTCHYGGSGAWPLPTKQADGAWVPGAWVEVEGNIEACSNGLHACRDEQVLEWLGPAMFELEYDGEPIDAGGKVVGRRARLLRRFEAWDERSARLFACDCAERVLPIYERDHPNDRRPRAAIETARRYANGEATKEKLAAALAAAQAAAWDAAQAAARAAAQAAAWYAAWYAARDAAWAAARDATWDAAWADARDAAWADARDAERAWQWHRLCEYLEG